MRITRGTILHLSLYNELGAIKCDSIGIWNDPGSEEGKHDGRETKNATGRPGTGTEATPTGTATTRARTGAGTKA
jgi:hypothetical protein